MLRTRLNNPLRALNHFTEVLSVTDARMSTVRGITQNRLPSLAQWSSDRKRHLDAIAGANPSRSSLGAGLVISVRCIHAKSRQQPNTAPGMRAMHGPCLPSFKLLRFTYATFMLFILNVWVFCVSSKPYSGVCQLPYTLHWLFTITFHAT